MEKKVEVVSCVSGSVSINVPELRLMKVWNGKGAKNLVDREQLTEAFYEPGVEYMFSHGILYIKDAELRKELGLDSDVDDAAAPKVLMLTDTQIDDYLTKKQQWEFEKIFTTLSREQQYSIIEYAISHEMVDMKKADIMKKIYGVDIISAIKLKRENQEPLPVVNDEQPNRR